ncbi:FabA-like domain protein [Lactobacillus ultunensis DSM 16047]|uniref:FabA-like domain protein n=1 Tax=Lactobacillus ultunensis DSM 16047 TaxID=525365 RepID=C2EKW5_9LACO|nr:FabA-like domain protein [Lactobacillus ultunensis DSM 16047]
MNIKLFVNQNKAVDQVTINAAEIKQLTGNQSPLSLLDQVLEIDPGKSLVGLKNVSANESYFAGHFPGNPVMPGVLIIQTGIEAVQVLNGAKWHGKLSEIKKARFRKMVKPGDQLEIKISKKDSEIYEAKAMLNDDVACSVELLFS